MFKQVSRFSHDCGVYFTWNCAILYILRRLDIKGLHLHFFVVTIARVGYGYVRWIGEYFVPRNHIKCSSFMDIFRRVKHKTISRIESSYWLLLLPDYRDIAPTTARGKVYICVMILIAHALIAIYIGYYSYHFYHIKFEGLRKRNKLQDRLQLSRSPSGLGSVILPVAKSSPSEKSSRTRKLVSSASVSKMIIGCSRVGFGGDSEIPSVESISALCSFSGHFPYFVGTRAEPWIPTWPSRRGGAR